MWPPGIHSQDLSVVCERRHVFALSRRYQAFDETSMVMRQEAKDGIETPWEKARFCFRGLATTKTCSIDTVVSKIFQLDTVLQCSLLHRNRLQHYRIKVSGDIYSRSIILPQRSRSP